MQTEALTHLQLLIRPGPEKNSIVGRLKSVEEPPENITKEDQDLINDIESPFRIVFTTDGQQAKLFTKKDEHKYALKTKDSVLKLLLQNTTEIEAYLNRDEKNIRDEGCQTVINVEQTEKEIIFETETKILDCDNKTALQGYVSEQSQFKLFYHLDKADNKLIKGKSIIDLIYLTTVSARIKTVQKLDFVRFDGLKDDIDESLLIQAHTSDEIDELWKLPAQ